MAWRSDDYEPQGGWSLPEGVALWGATLFAGGLFGGVASGIYQLVAGRPPVWLAVVAFAAGVGLGSWIVKPWRR